MTSVEITGYAKQSGKALLLASAFALTVGGPVAERAEAQDERKSVWELHTDSPLFGGGEMELFPLTLSARKRGQVTKAYANYSCTTSEDTTVRKLTSSCIEVV